MRAPESDNPRSVLVVHGRNEALRLAMFEFLRSIDLSPLEWTSAVALTGEGSPYIGQVLDVAFEHAQAVVVLITPDDVAYLQTCYANGPSDPETQPAAQARPNVLFEAGMAFGLDSTRTILVEVGDVRPFSDIAGRHTVRMSNELDRRQALAQRLQSAGCQVDATGTDWHSAGDFTAPSAPGDGFPLGRRVPSTDAARQPVDFDLRYIRKGGNKIEKLQIINRGYETAYEVSLEIPESAALDLRDVLPVAKIPGGGKSVTIDVLNFNRFTGERHDNAFDVTVTARKDSGESVTQEVFLDLNG